MKINNIVASEGYASTGGSVPDIYQGQTLLDFVRTKSLLLNESIVPQLVDEINTQILVKQSDGLEDIELYERRLKEVERKIDKLIDAIAEGISASSLSKKLDILEQQKEEFEVKLESLKVAHEINKLPMISEKEVLQLINKVKQYVVDRNIPECKKFIRDFVKRVDVYQDHVEVTFNVAFSMSKHLIHTRRVEIHRIGSNLIIEEVMGENYMYDLKKKSDRV